MPSHLWEYLDPGHFQKRERHLYRWDKDKPSRMNNFIRFLPSNWNSKELSAAHYLNREATPWFFSHDIFSSFQWQVLKPTKYQYLNGTMKRYELEHV